MIEKWIPAPPWNPQVISEIPEWCAASAWNIDSDLSALERRIDSDLRTLIGAAEDLRRALAGLEEQVARIETDLRLQTASFSDPIRVTFNRRTGSGNLSINEQHGYLTLPVVGQEPFPAVRYLWIDPDASSGIPGNNLTVRSIRPSKDQSSPLPEVQLTAEFEPNADALRIVDGRLDTMFEWEINAILTNQPAAQVEGVMYLAGGDKQINVQEATRGFGWEVDTYLPGHDQPIVGVPLARFVTSESQLGEPAKVTMQLGISTDRDLWMEITPHHVGTWLTRLLDLSVSDDGIHWRTVAAGRDLVSLSGEIRRWRWFIGKPQAVRVSLQAGGWYAPRLGLGHLFRARRIRETRRTRFLGFVTLSSNTKYYWERLPTNRWAVGTIMVETERGTQIVSRAIAGAIGAFTTVGRALMTQIFGAKAVAWAAARLGSIAIPIIGAVVAIAALGDVLFSTSVERRVVDEVQGVDVFAGWRSAVSIREIGFSQETYERTGSWVSDPMELPVPARVVRLRAHDYVPEGCTLRYQVQFGDGEWVPVDPHGEGTVRVDVPTTSCRVRIDMSTDDVSRSPVVYGFQVQAK